MVKSVYVTIIIAMVLTFIKVSETVLNFGGGYAHFALLFILPIILTVAWFMLLKETKTKIRWKDVS